MQITVDDEQYILLRERSRSSGASIAELIRRAIDESFRMGDRQARLDNLRESAGAWADRPAGSEADQGAEYVESLRRGA